MHKKRSVSELWIKISSLITVSLVYSLWNAYQCVQGDYNCSLNQQHDIQELNGYGTSIDKDMRLFTSF